MTDTLPHVVVPYAEFLERRERRRRIAAELQRREGQRTIDVAAVSMSPAEPRTGDAIITVSDDAPTSDRNVIQ
jgi:hypothetical protein